MINNIPLSRSSFTEIAEVFNSKSLPVPPTGIDDDQALETPYPCPPELDLLRIQQRAALESLMAGASYNESARSAGVDRKTLYNWVHKDPAFQAAMDSWRRRALVSARPPDASHRCRRPHARSGSHPRLPRRRHPPKRPRPAPRPSRHRQGKSDRSGPVAPAQ